MLQVAVLVVWLLAIFYNLGNVAEAHLSPTISSFCSALSVPPRLAGVSLLAWSNGAPDLSADVRGILQTLLHVFACSLLLVTWGT
jgi:solute carrier family 24 (sodium/potassium/calcium exchanger), member 6